ncbi:hypothetical protein L1049_024475 [Liquidambar formosana]|uniref:Uncharacterized protein n=1 Tax=Liquidambar formosana TaxID=63359 RepID=A0AAP0RUX9_LIQFO
MSREERRRKFHEAILKMLYPPPPPQENADESMNTSREAFNVESISDAGDLERSSATSSTDDEGECGPQKLSRAQRKRLRKKKLKEAASCRRKIIGPLLPSTIDDGSGSGGDGGSVLEYDPPSVRHNVAEEGDTAIDEPGGETPACSNQNKLKQRRKAKRLARERENSSDMENRERDHHQPCGKDERLS